MSEQRKYRMIAAITTLIVVIVTLTLLFAFRLHYTPADGSEWPPQPDTTAVLLADEYIEIEPLVIPPSVTGGDSEEEGAAAPPPDAQDFTNAGQPAEETTPLTSSEQPSPLKTEKRTPVKPTGPKESDQELAHAREKRIADSIHQAANARTQRFGKMPGAQGDGESNAGTGQASTPGRRHGQGSGGGLGSGRKLSVADRNIYSNRPGVIVIRVNVSADGKISNPVVEKDEIKDPQLTAACKAAALKASVTGPAAGKDETGRITFSFK